MRRLAAVYAGLGVGLLNGVVAGQAPNRAVLRGAVQTESGEPVEGARVEVRGLGQSAISRSDGTFRLEGIKPGRYWVTVTRPGLDPQRKAITLEGSDDRLLEFHLGAIPPGLAERRAAELDSLSRAFAERLRLSLDGVFLTRDDIERSRQPQLGAVLANYLVQTAPRTGVRGSAANCAPYESWITQSAQGYPGDPQAYPFVSVNGGRPFRGRALYEFDPADVEALEFYRGGGPTFGFLPTAAQCGLVILWTK